MTYNMINSTLMQNNLAYLFVYANEVTHDLFGRMMVIAFFLVILVASSMMQLRFQARVNFPSVFLASSFATFGFVVILEQVSGILSPSDFIVVIAVLIISIIVQVTSSNEP